MAPGSANPWDFSRGRHCSHQLIFTQHHPWPKEQRRLLATTGSVQVKMARTRADHAGKSRASAAPSSREQGGSCAAFHKVNEPSVLRVLRFLPVGSHLPSRCRDVNRCYSLNCFDQTFFFLDFSQAIRGVSRGQLPTLPWQLGAWEKCKFEPIYYMLTLKNLTLRKVCVIYATTRQAENTRRETAFLRARPLPSPASPARPAPPPYLLIPRPQPPARCPRRPQNGGPLVSSALQGTLALPLRTPLSRFFPAWFSGFAQAPDQPRP